VEAAAEELELLDDGCRRCQGLFAVPVSGHSGRRDRGRAGRRTRGNGARLWAWATAGVACVRVVGTRPEGDMNRSVPTCFALFALTLSGTAMAGDGTPVISGELSNTGHTLREGVNQLSLGTQYYRGVTEDFQMGTRVLGWLGGANLSGEYAILQSDDSAFSAGADLSYYWSGGYTVGVVPTYTLGGQKTNRVNASLGVSYTKLDLDVGEVTGNEEDNTSFTSLSVPLHLSYDLVPSDQTTFRFRFETDVKADIDGAFVFKGGAAWNHGWNKYRLALGVDVTNAGLAELEQIFNFLGVGQDLPPVYPLPYVRMWWRF